MNTVEQTQERRQFPKGPAGESGPARRARYEAWLLEDPHLSPELAAVKAQPNHDPSLTHASLRYAIRARCVQCVHGADDTGYRERIERCEQRTCTLWSVRPYMPEGAPATVALVKREDVKFGDYAARALALPGQRRPAVNGYCFDCQGGRAMVSVMQLVSECQVGNFALWMVRPTMKPDQTCGTDSMADPGDSDADAAQAAVAIDQEAQSW